MDLYSKCQPFIVVDNFISDKNFYRQGIGVRLFKRVQEIALAKDCANFICLPIWNVRKPTRSMGKWVFIRVSNEGLKNYCQNISPAGVLWLHDLNFDENPSRCYCHGFP